MFLLEPPLVELKTSVRPTPNDVEFERLEDLEKLRLSFEATLKTVHLTDRVCPSGPPCPNEVDGMVIRPDRYHYSFSSSLWVAKWLVPKILMAARK